MASVTHTRNHKRWKNSHAQKKPKKAKNQKYRTGTSNQKRKNKKKLKETHTGLIHKKKVTASLTDLVCSFQCPVLVCCRLSCIDFLYWISLHSDHWMNLLWRKNEKLKTKIFRKIKKFHEKFFLWRHLPESVLDSKTIYEKWWLGVYSSHGTYMELEKKEFK